MMMHISELTGFCCIMSSLDAILKPLPYLAQSLLSTLFISVVPIFLIYLMNSFMPEKSRDKFVHILLSFALGGLLGDVFFHTLPHLMESGNSHTDHSHSH
jgi:TctA family transporter